MTALDSSKRSAGSFQVVLDFDKAEHAFENDLGSLYETCPILYPTRYVFLGVQINTHNIVNDAFFP